MSVQGQTHAVTIVECDGVSIRHCERSSVRTTIYVSDRRLTDSFDARFRTKCAAPGATPCNVWITDVSTTHELISSRSRGDRCNGNIGDPNRDSIPDLCSRDSYRAGYLVSAANYGRNHWAPTSWGCICDDMPTVTNRPQHGPRGIKQAIGELIHKDRLTSDWFYSFLGELSH
jgi:hypothetical protein